MFVRTRFNPFVFFSLVLILSLPRVFLLYIPCFPLISASVFCVSSLFCRYFVKFGIPFSLVSLSDVFLFCPVACLPCLVQLSVWVRSVSLSACLCLFLTVSLILSVRSIGFLRVCPYFFFTVYGLPPVWSSLPPVCPFMTGYYLLTDLDLTCLTFTSAYCPKLGK